MLDETAFRMALERKTTRNWLPALRPDGISMKSARAGPAYQGPTTEINTARKKMRSLMRLFLGECCCRLTIAPALPTRLLAKATEVVPVGGGLGCRLPRGRSKIASTRRLQQVLSAC